MEQLKKKVRIVPMTNEYLNDVAELERTCFSNPWSRNMLAEELENACSAFLVALDAENGSVVGYAGLLAVADEGCITKMAVRPDCRRGGVAGQLLDVFIRFAEGSGLAFLTLEVRESNYAAIALYGSRGFRGEGAMADPLLEDLDGALPNLGRMRASPSCFRHTCHFLALTVNLLSYVQVR